jgi:uncharacterized protein (DUF1778 family)
MSLHPPSQDRNRTGFAPEWTAGEDESNLLDQSSFRLDDVAYSQFTALLDTPPQPSPALSDLLRSKPPWQERSQDT